MFVESEFSWSIAVQPHQLKSKRHIQKALVRSLLKRFDDINCTEEHGYFVAVTSIEDIGDGTVREAKGCVTYAVSFRGLTFKPFKGEIALAIVLKVAKDRVVAEFGPGRIVIKNLEDGLMGGYKFQEEEGMYKHMDGSLISDGTIIRVEITETTWDREKGCEKDEFFTMGSLKGEYLGVVKHSTRKSGEATGDKRESVSRV